MKPGLSLILLFTLLLLIAAGCSQPVPSTPAPATPVVYIVYGSEKGDLSYTDAAYQGLLASQKERGIAIREFVPGNYETLPALLNTTKETDKPVLVITVGFQYADFTRRLAEQHKDIRFLAIDQAGIGAENLRACEITSYGDSFLSGVLAASASKTQRVGIVMGMKSDVLDAFLQGYTDGAHAVNSSIVIDHTYVHQHSTDGFSDPDTAGRAAEGLFANGTDVIFACAGYSNTGVFRAAGNATNRYVIGTDSDQSPLGPDRVLASAVKRVDRIVSSGINDTLDGRFRGGNVTVGLKEGVTGIIFNPRFASYNESVSARETLARAKEEAFLHPRAQEGLRTG